MPKIVDLVLESIKFATTVLVWTLLNRWIPDADSFAWSAITDVLIALLAGLISYLVLGLLFARTVVRTSWTVDGDSVQGGVVDLRLSSANAASVRLELRVEQVSLMVKLLYAIYPNLAFTIVYTFRPETTLRYVRQHGPKASMHQNRLTFRLTEGLWPGSVAFALVSMERLHPSGGDDEVHVSTKIAALGRRVPLGILIGNQVGISKVVLRGN